MLEIPKKSLTLTAELFDSIAPKNAEIRTVTKSLLLKFKNYAKGLFLNRSSQTDEKLKYKNLRCNINHKSIFLLFNIAFNTKPGSIFYI